MLLGQEKFLRESNSVLGAQLLVSMLYQRTGKLEKFSRKANKPKNQIEGGTDVLLGRRKKSKLFFCRIFVALRSSVEGFKLNFQLLHFLKKL